MDKATAEIRRARLLVRTSLLVPPLLPVAVGVPLLTGGGDPSRYAGAFGCGDLA